MSARPANVLLQGLLVACVGAASLLANADFRSPPRYDGAGYAVLARSILDGRGYREIDHPDAPRHAHFPPGYPIALAAIWSITGPSAVSAHAFSFACTIGAIVLAWAWFRRAERPGVAILMGLALAANWRWGRDGAAIQSEPLFLLLSMIAMLASAWVADRGGWARGLALGVLLGAVVLTRHVGLALVIAVVVDLLMRGRRIEALSTGLAALAMIAPWLFWLASVRNNTQVGLVPGRGLGAVVGENALFYARRLIDQILGPVVEIATVFRPSYSGGATAFAVLAAAPIVAGWIRLLVRPERRRDGLVPSITMMMLLAWPFTEAGRFLIPLIPFLIVGAVEGLAPMMRWISRDRAREFAAAAVLAASLPYSIYAIVSHRAEAARSTNREFDDACAWLARHATANGPVMTRHPGEVFWLTGRTAIAPPDGDVAKSIERYQIAYLLIDDARFALAPRSPLGQFLRDFPDRVEKAHVVEGDRPVVIYRVRNPG